VEGSSVEAGPANERAIDIRQHDQFVDVVWLDAAVEVGRPEQLLCNVRTLLCYRLSCQLI
jgi:hypothetical protein